MAAREELFDGGVHGGKAGGAGGIHHVVGPLSADSGCHTGGLDIQGGTVRGFEAVLTGHTIFEVVENLHLLLLGEGGKGLGLFQVPAKLGVVVLEVQVVAGLVAEAASHDDSGALQGEPLAFRVPCHLEGLEGGVQGHLLASGDQLPCLCLLAVGRGIEGEGIHGGGQLGVGAVHGLAVGVVEEGEIHTGRVYLFDGVLLGFDALPEGIDIQGVGIDTAHADDGDLVIHHRGGGGHHFQLI